MSRGWKRWEGAENECHWECLDRGKGGKDGEWKKWCFEGVGFAEAGWICVDRIVGKSQMVNTS